jgi:hypothetical protein
MLIGVMTAGLATSPARAVIFSGQITIEEISGNGGSLDDYSIESFAFTVATAGNIEFDVLAFETSGSDFIGPSSTLNVLDTQILVVDSSNVQQGYNDDASVALSSDGTVINLDAYLNLSLSSGDYVLYVGSSVGILLTPTLGALGYNVEIVSAIFDCGFQRDLGGNCIGALDHSPGDFNVTVTALTGSLAGPPPPTAMPEPATLTLFGLGLLGFGAARRRKKRAA